MTDNHNGQSPVPEQDDAVQGEVLSDCPLVVAKEQQVPPQEPVQTRRPVAFGVFLACILFGFLLSMQFKSVDISSNALTSQQLRAEELQSLLNKEREKNQELYEELLRGKDDLSQYRDQALQSGAGRDYRIGPFKRERYEMKKADDPMEQILASAEKLGVDMSVEN